MPIYEYECKACGFATEVIQKLSDPILTECTSCGAAAFHKKISAPSFRLAGAGWYETDFKTGDKKNLVGGSTEKPSSENTAPEKGDSVPKKKTSGLENKSSMTRSA